MSYCKALTLKYLKVMPVLCNQFGKYISMSSEYLKHSSVSKNEKNEQCELYMNEANIS